MKYPNVFALVGLQTAWLSLHSGLHVCNVWKISNNVLSQPRAVQVKALWTVTDGLGLCHFFHPRIASHSLITHFFLTVEGKWAAFMSGLKYLAFQTGFFKCKVS